MNASSLSQIRCGSTVLPLHILNFHSGSTLLDYPRIKDNLHTALLEDGHHPYSISKMKHGVGSGHHPRVEDNLQTTLSKDGHHSHSTSRMKHGSGSGRHPGIELNLQTSLLDDGRHPLCISQMKHGSGSGHYLGHEGNVHLLCSFLSNVTSIVAPGIPCSCNS